MAFISSRRGFLIGSALVGAGAAAFLANRFVGDDQFDPSTQAYLARCETQPSSLQAAALNALIVSLKGYGLWDKLDALWDLQAETPQRALLNMKDQKFNLTLEGNTTHRPGFGLRGDGSTGFLRTGIRPNAGDLVFTLQSAMIGVFCAINTNGGNSYALGAIDGNLRLKTRQVPAEAPSGFLNDEGAPLNGPPMSGLLPGLVILNREASNSVSVVKNGMRLVSETRPATQLMDDEILIGRAGSRFSEETYAFAFVGGGLDEGEMRAFNAVVRDYLIASMTPIVCFGDSLTQGVRNRGRSPLATTTSYPSQLEALQNRVVFNGGIGGQTSIQIRERAEPDNFMNAAVNIIWMGRNNYKDTDRVLADIESVANRVVGGRFAVLSILNGDYPPEHKDLDGYKIIMGLNDTLSKRYGDKYIDVRSQLLAAANPNDPGDMADIADDVPPRSLRSDQLHLNDAGDTVIAKTVSEFLKKKGW